MLQLASSCEYFCSGIKEYTNYASLSPPRVSIGVIHLYSLTEISHEAVSTIAVVLKINHSLQTLKWVDSNWYLCALYGVLKI